MRDLGLGESDRDELQRVLCLAAFPGLAAVTNTPFYN